MIKQSSIRKIMLVFPAVIFIIVFVILTIQVHKSLNVYTNIFKENIPVDFNNVSNTPHNNPSINLSGLPLPEAFCNSTFYGNKALLKYQWYFKPRKRKVSPLDYKIMRGSSKICSANERLDLVILVISLHHMDSQRQAIRDTWGSVSTLGKWPGLKQPFFVRVVFVLGFNKNNSLNKVVATEADERGDIVLVQVRDSYYNLTRKVLMGFKWIRDFCFSARYVMKVDEDTYMNLPTLLELINSRSWVDLIYGHYHFADPVARKQKYEVSKEAYPARVYPPHVKGNLYFMTTNVAMKILTVSEYMPYVNMEDIFITGILAKPFNIKHVDIPKSRYNPLAPAAPCELATGKKTISQMIFDETLYEIWRRVKEPPLCSAIRPNSTTVLGNVILKYS